jgi:arginine exporter protein ArgO
MNPMALYTLHFHVVIVGAIGHFIINKEPSGAIITITHGNAFTKTSGISGAIDPSVTNSNKAFINGPLKRENYCQALYFCCWLSMLDPRAILYSFQKALDAASSLRQANA